MLAKIITIGIIVLVAIIIATLGLLIHREEKRIEKRLFWWKKKR